MPRLVFNPLHGTFDFVSVDGEDTTVGAILIGPINGSNLTFTTPEKFVGGTLRLHFNGVRVFEPDDYATMESGGSGTGYDTIVFVAGLVPKAGDRLLADYIRFV